MAKSEEDAEIMKLIERFISALETIADAIEDGKLQPIVTVNNAPALDLSKVKAS